TVLDQKHFEVFRQRMREYPVRIEMLSRFRSHSEQKKVLQLLREGGVDIVIGTHRLISGDVVFKNLGLVVIDEEQRFGVLHKEKFKDLFKLVDVLTLSEIGRASCRERGEDEQRAVTEKENTQT